jgi:threonine/homoserine/homoserine lactone efflux protein
MLDQFILPAISLGLSATAIPGPLQAYLLNVTLRYGWRYSLLVIVSPLITDGPIALVIVFLLEQMPPDIIQIIRLVGGLVLLWIAWNAAQQLRAGATFEARSTDDDDPPTDAAISPWRILGTGVAMNALSPGPYLFWATVTGPMLLDALALSGWHALAFIATFYGIFLGGMVGLALAFDRLGRINPQVTQILLRVTIVLLVWFGTSLIAEAFGLSVWHQRGTVALLAFGALWMIYRRLR